MAIAREMVELHGGALTVESEPGLGSTFTFTLPLGCDHLDPDDIAKPFAVPERLERIRVRLPVALERPVTADQAWLEKLQAWVHAGMANPDFGVRELARQVGYSDRQLRRRTLARCGATPAAVLLKARLEAAHEMIEARRHGTVAEVAHAVGLSPAYFSRRCRQAYHCADIRL